MASKGLPPKKALKDLELLAKAGFSIPEQLVGLVQTEADKKDGVKQVWHCGTCESTYKAEVKVSAMSCGRGHSMKLVKTY